MESLYKLWELRIPKWEKKYEESLVRIFTDYGKGTTQYSEDRGKVFGAGYELFIIAFFIGLYANQTKPLTEDRSKIKTFGHEIKYWGNQTAKIGRTSYTQIREYMFAALVARTDVDFLALDKGDITPQEVVGKLLKKMEEYANFGFDYLQEKMEEQPDRFFQDGAFLQLFLDFLKPTEKESSEDDDTPEDF